LGVMLPWSMRRSTCSHDTSGDVKHQRLERLHPSKF
jgi:hypothetical protein